MYKLIIVDDEEITRQGIKESIIGIPDIEIVGEASNGFEALILIHNLSPDIIICDIRMPKLDGISLINEIQPENPNLQIIFLSGYSDKEYLKNAIKLEAVDFIYKPFQLSELVLAIEKAKKNCQKNKSNLNIVNPDIALELLHYSENDSIDKYSSLPISLNKPMITIIIKINPAKVEYSTSTFDNVFDVRVIANHYFNAFKSIASVVFKDRYVISCVGAGYVIHSNIDEPFSYENSPLHMLYEFFNFTKGGKSAIAISVGNTCSSVNELRVSYSQAREAMQATLLSGYGSIIFYRNLSKIPFKPNQMVQQNFYDKIMNNDFTNATTFLNGYFDYMSRCSPQDIPYIKDEIVSIAFWMNERLESVSSDTQKYVTDVVNYAYDIKVLNQYLINQIETYINEVANLDNKGRILIDVEKYITQNYNKELSIKSIAEKVFISPNYLCYIYKKNTGRTLNQFILDVKMNKAKEFICETNMKLSDISDKLGYTNQNYFTRTFTKYFKFSPRVYRNKFCKISTVVLQDGDNEQ